MKVASSPSASMKQGSRDMATTAPGYNCSACSSGGLIQQLEISAAVEDASQRHFGARAGIRAADLDGR